MPSTVDEVLSLVKSTSVSQVRFLYCDTAGVVRGKCVPTRKLRQRLVSGVGLVKGMMAMNVLDQMQVDSGYGPIGEVRLSPDLDTYQHLPYSPRNAAFISDLNELDGKNWKLCPRGVLKRQVENARNKGFEIKAAFEPEFMVGESSDGHYEPIDRGLCFSTESMNRGEEFIGEFLESLEAQGLHVEAYYPELGAGQHEVSIEYAPALSAADRHIFYRETLRGVAFKNNLVAYMAPKPFIEHPGNGCHLHRSAWSTNTGDNLFWAEDGFSVIGKHFVAGLLEHLPGLLAITCPTVNSYRRLKPRNWSSAFVTWGYENREAAVRIPSPLAGEDKDSTNIELKFVDASCNPFLALAAVIAAGMEGVDKESEPPPPIDCDPGHLDEAQRKDRNINAYPQSLKEALNALEQDEMLMEVLGDDLARTYLVVKTSECSTFASEGIEFELEAHRNKF